MLNNVGIVGRIANNPKLIEENGHKCSYIVLAVNRDFRNNEGIYETDFIDIKVFYPMCDSLVEYCHKGDLIGVKGRLETGVCENENGEKFKITFVFAEKITFLSSRKSKEIKELFDKGRLIKND